MTSAPNTVQTRLAVKSVITPDTAPDTVQQISVTVEATPGTDGTSMLAGRNASIQAIGCCHCQLVCGPDGPLNGPVPRSPQRPPKVSQAKGPPGVTLSGSKTACGSTRSDGALELSQPRPVPSLPKP